MEQLIVTEEVQKFIRGDVEDISTDLIEKTAQKASLITLEQEYFLVFVGKPLSMKSRV